MCKTAEIGFFFRFSLREKKNDAMKMLNQRLEENKKWFVGKKKRKRKKLKSSFS